MNNIITLLQVLIATVIDASLITLLLLILLVVVVVVRIVVVVVVEVVIFTRIYTCKHTEVNCYRKSCTSVSNARYLVCLLPPLKVVGGTLLGLGDAVHLDTFFFPGQLEI